MSEIQGFLIDLDGVLYIEDCPIPGAIEAINVLRERRYPLRFLTNTTMKSRDTLVNKLRGMGIRAESREMFSTAVVAAQWLAEKGMTRVQLLLPDDPLKDFSDFTITTDHPEAVVVGDLSTQFTFDVLNDAFLSVRAGATLVALQKNRFWRTTKGLSLDVGPFVAALEYATETEAVLIGKPNRAYFETALNDMKLPASKAAMVGDDVHTDIVGAHTVGIKTVLVKTGKFPFDADKPFPVHPDWILNSIADLPELLPKKKK
jgi:HAD superfamily hydrolase (TIGR01458 family)